MHTLARTQKNTKKNLNAKHSRVVQKKPNEKPTSSSSFTSNICQVDNKLKNIISYRINYIGLHRPDNWSRPTKFANYLKAKLRNNHACSLHGASSSLAANCSRRADLRQLRVGPTIDVAVIWIAYCFLTFRRLHRAFVLCIGLVLWSIMIKKRCGRNKPCVSAGA